MVGKGLIRLRRAFKAEAEKEPILTLAKEAARGRKGIKLY